MLPTPSNNSTVFGTQNLLKDSDREMNKYSEYKMMKSEVTIRYDIRMSYAFKKLLLNVDL